MKTLGVYALEFIKVLDIVPRIIKFVARVVKKIFAGAIGVLTSIIVKTSRGRAPPTKKILKKEKGGSRS